MRAETPSEVLFDFLKCDLQINNREAARILISDKPMGSKPAPRFRITEKTFLSRRVVHVVPGTDKIDPEMFTDFSQSVQNLAAAVKIDSGSSPAAANARQQAIATRTLERMAKSLDYWGSMPSSCAISLTASPSRRASSKATGGFWSSLR